jgi:hypothetical protein
VLLNDHEDVCVRRALDGEDACCTLRQPSQAVIHQDVVPRHLDDELDTPMKSGQTIAIRKSSETEADFVPTSELKKSRNSHDRQQEKTSLLAGAPAPPEVYVS